MAEFKMILSAFPKVGFSKESTVGREAWVVELEHGL